MGGIGGREGEGEGGGGGKDGRVLQRQRRRVGVVREMLVALRE